jgi:signal transduction histidine kinase
MVAETVGRGILSGYAQRWAVMSTLAQAATAVTVACAALAAAAQITSLASAGQGPWAADLGWALAGVAMLTGCLSATLRVRPRSAVWRAWCLYVVGAAFWVAGAVIRLAVTGSSLSAAAASCWLALAVCCIASFAVRLPRIYIFGIFLLDAIPVVLLVLVIARQAELPTAVLSTQNAVLLTLYPALYVLLAANAIQMAGIHLTLSRVPPSVWLFTSGFALMSLASLVWPPAAIVSGTPQGHPSDALWTLGLLLLAGAGVTRALSPAGFTTLPPVELAKGPHALPAASAILGLIIMLAVVPASERLLVLAFLAIAAGDLSVRVIQLRQDDQRLLTRLASQNKQLQELSKMKEEFVSLVSHELRTPLTSIVGYLELLDDGEAGPLTSRQREFTAVMHRSVHRLLRLVGDLLFVARLQSGKLPVNLDEADLPEITRLGVESARPVADGKDISITLSCSPVPHLVADPERLAQLLDNLLSNAIKFTPRGGRVTVAVGVEDGTATLDVHDTGLGISASDQEHVFERFFRTRTASTRAIAGTGLGLAISKAIVDAHNGTISLSSEMGKGTTFRIRLPLRTGN